MEVIQFTELRASIQQFQHTQDVQDSLKWKWTTNGIFSVQSAYLIQFEGRTRSWMQSTVWNSDAPLKCKFFAWLASLNRCLTTDNMLKRGWTCDPICKLCLVENETCLHLMLQCPFSAQIWDLVQAKLQITLNPGPVDADDFSQWWLKQVISRTNNAARSLNAVITLVCWSIWKERNARTFNNICSSTAVVFSKIVNEPATWHQAGRTIIGV